MSADDHFRYERKLNMPIKNIEVSRVRAPQKGQHIVTPLCPLSMIAGKPVTCDDNCKWCIPDSLATIAAHLRNLECLNLPNDMFGNGTAQNGLDGIAGAISELASAMEDRR